MDAIEAPKPHGADPRTPTDDDDHAVDTIDGYAEDYTMFYAGFNGSDRGHPGCPRCSYEARAEYVSDDTEGDDWATL